MIEELIVAQVSNFQAPHCLQVVPLNFVSTHGDGGERQECHMRTGKLQYPSFPAYRIVLPVAVINCHTKGNQ